jgi:hypothetical protein
MFTDQGCALIIEFYRLSPKIDVPWKISYLIGWSAIRLDSRCKTILEKDMINGFKTEYLLVEDFVDKTNANSATVVLRLNEKVIIGFSFNFLFTI